MEDRLCVARQRLTELDATTFRDHLGQDLSPVLQRHVAQIMPVEVQQIEGDEIEVVLAAGDGFAQRLEVGQPVSLVTITSPSMMAPSTSSLPAALARIL